MPSVSMAYKTPGQLTDKEEEDLDPTLRKQLQEEAKERKSMMSKDLGLPELLEARRQEFGITDGAFALAPIADRILVYQISRHKEETFKGTGIIMPDTVKSREKKQTPQGIIVAAGAKALDELRCNGIDLGHMVAFLRIAPWRIETDTVKGTAEDLMVFRVGDIIGSVDLQDQIRKGIIKVVFDKEAYEHAYLDTRTGESWHPQTVDPAIPETM